MTVATSDYEVVHTGNGATLTFAFTFTVIEDADLVVELRTASTNVVTSTLVLDTDYTVDTDYPDAGGSVTLLVAAPAGTVEVVIRREVTYTQDLDIINQGGFYPATIQQQLDKIVMMIQQLDQVRQHSVASAPDAADFAEGKMIWVTDETGGAVLAFSDGTDWRRVTDRAIIA